MKASDPLLKGTDPDRFQSIDLRGPTVIFVKDGSGPQGLSPLAAVQLSVSSDYDSPYKTETANGTLARVTIASTLSLAAFNLNNFFSKNHAKYTLSIFILSNLGIILGNAIAFPPKGDCTYKLMKFVVCAGIGQLTLLPYLYWSKEKVGSEIAIGLIYATSLAILWNLTETPKNEKCGKFRRILGAIIAVGTHKLSTRLLSEDWATSASNIGIATGNIISFYPEKKNRKWVLLTLFFLGVDCLSTSTVRDMYPYPWVPTALTTLLGIPPLLTLWYYGRRNLVKSVANSNTDF